MKFFKVIALGMAVVAVRTQHWGGPATLWGFWYCDPRLDARPTPTLEGRHTFPDYSGFIEVEAPNCGVIH